MNPLLTYLAYSGGAASHALLEMVLRGHIERPQNFLVLTANPGMEDERSYGIVENAVKRCMEQGISVISPVPGKDLYQDLITMTQVGVTRMDHPPYWTRNRETGKRGRLKQKCTRQYKIRPMQRALRLHMSVKFGISVDNTHLPKVHCWIGFTADEVHRVSKSPPKEQAKFLEKRYPLIEMGIDQAKLHGYYMKHSIIKPPRSVCCACFANGLAYFEDMYNNRPDDWDKAVAVDEAVRDMRQQGVEDEVFVSSSLVPLKDLPAMNFKHSDADYREHRCNSGVCFT